MATLGMSRREISFVLGVSERALARRKLDKAMQVGQAHLCKSIRMAQIKTALIDRNPALLIWLGKQLLEQREPPHGLEISGKIEHDIATPDELRTGILSRLTRIVESRGTGGGAEIDVTAAAPSASQELRLLGPGEPAGADGSGVA